MEKRRNSKGGRSFERRLLLGIIPLILAALFTVSLLLYHVAERNIQTKVSQYMEQYLVQCAESIDNRLETTVQLNGQLSVNPQLTEILRRYHTASYSQQMAYREEMEDLFLTILSIYEDIHGVYVFDAYGNEFYLRSRSGMDGRTLDQADWYRQALEREGDYVIFLDDHGGKKEMSIGIARSVVDIYTRESCGVTLVEIPYGVLEESVSGGIGDRTIPGSIRIRDEQGQLIYVAGGGTDDGELSLGSPGQPETEVYRDASGQRSIRITYTSPETGWSYTYLCPMRQLMAEMKEFRLTVFALVAVVGLCTVGIVLGFSHRIVRPLGRLVEAMRKLQEGDYAVQVEPGNTDEFQYLGRTFNEMAASIQELIQKVYHAQLAQKEAQLEALQQQINPHFLCNTFETMRGLAISEHSDRVADMARRVSEFMRYNMYGNDGDAELQMELRHVANYIRIMDYRFDDKITLTTDLPPEMETLRLPRFTLQPLVENAVLHGFRDKNADCRITIEGSIQGDDAVVRVRDNGAGIAPESLAAIDAELRRGDSGDDGTRRRIGIFNVNSRLRLNYGPQYGVRLHSATGVGTTAEITFPVRYGDGPDHS